MFSLFLWLDAFHQRRTTIGYSFSTFIIIFNIYYMKHYQYLWYFIQKAVIPAPQAVGQDDPWSTFQVSSSTVLGEAQAPSSLHCSVQHRGNN